MCSDRFRIPPHPTRIGVGSGSPPHPTRIGVGLGRGGVAPTHGFKGKPHFLRGRGALLAIAFQYMRSHCLYTLAGLRETVPLSLSQDASDVPQRLTDSEELPVVGLLMQRRFARISHQFRKAYLQGAGAVMLSKQYTRNAHTKGTAIQTMRGLAL